MRGDEVPEPLRRLSDNSEANSTMVSESPTMVMHSSVAGRDQTAIGRGQ